MNVLQGGSRHATIGATADTSGETAITTDDIAEFVRSSYERNDTAAVLGLVEHTLVGIDKIWPGSVHLPSANVHNLDGQVTCPA